MRTCLGWSGGDADMFRVVRGDAGMFRVVRGDVDMFIHRQNPSSPPGCQAPSVLGRALVDFSACNGTEAGGECAYKCSSGGTGVGSEREG